MSFSDKAEICPIQSCDIGQYEKIAVPFILSALEHTDGEVSLKLVLSDIATQQRQLWLVKTEVEFIAAVVSQMYTTEAGMKIGEVTLAGGRDFHLWDHFPSVLAEWFKSQGCHAFQVIGRHAWVRKLKSDGFTHRYTILRKDLRG